MTVDETPVPIGSWPPEVPPLRPPVPPSEPVPTRQPPAPAPSRLPSWEEPDERLVERDVYDRLLEHRIVVVGGRLDDELADRVAAQLLLLGRSREPVELHLTCPESDLAAALALADAVDLVAAPVHAIARGAVSGPAVAVLCAARRRLAHRNALFVLTVPAAPSGHGTAEQLQGLAEQHRRQTEQLLARLAGVTGHDLSDIEADLESRRLLTADEALDYGLVEELV